MKFDFYADPGHAWVKVPRRLLVDLGIEDRITHYSYQRGDWCYLEEDCDVTLFATTMEAQGTKPEWRWHQGDKRSKIRGYASFSPRK